ncbi:G-protein alpha subunit [Mycena belliarum]|uniref:G-protein alpha subunit n=1 Tax=Mycena belliarum TaxID=1033014 RepID=A0AAD6UFL5_9AGAR|nr:G-protein alpha subunit [Mycena belliae]
MPTRRGSQASYDPLAASLAPPADESDEARAARMEAAREAVRVSRGIDAGIADSRRALERKKRAVKILLLGQSESGKSSVLRNFRLAFTPKYFESERLVWRTVIQLNLISSIKKILAILQDEWAGLSPVAALSEDPHAPPSPSQDHAAPSQDPHSPFHDACSPPSDPDGSDAPLDDLESPDSPGLRALAAALSPLLAFETSITRLIGADGGIGAGVVVRPGGGWKDRLAAFGRVASGGASTISRGGNTSVMSASGFVDDGPGEPADPEQAQGLDSHPLAPERDDRADAREVTAVLAALAPRIGALWAHRGVRQVLKRQGVELREEGGFFLDDAARIAALDYVPTDRDIMRARIRTLGVEEHRFVTESDLHPGFRAGTEFFITDVCGSSSQRATWIPYFDDVQAILFLAPLAFWQNLDEDHNVNRVQDSLELWREIVGNRLLAKTAFILLFNKKDILQEHIKAGVLVKKYVPSFGDRTNDVASVTKYFRDKFSAYHRKFSPEPRPFIFYETEAIDTKSTAVILSEVQEQIIRNHLKDLDVIYTPSGARV